MSSARRCRAVCVQYRQICSSTFQQQQLQTVRLTGKSRGSGGREKGNNTSSGLGHRHTTATTRQYSTSFSTTTTTTTTTSSSSSSSQSHKAEHAPTPTRPSEYQTTGTGASASTTASSPINPTAAHHDLPSFLAHAHRTGLSTSSTVYNGTLYEYLAQETLRRHGFELHRVGGRGDRGVDLVGFWRVPKPKKGEPPSIEKQGDGDEHEHTLKVIVQCKRLVGKHAKIGPNLVRELDGAVRGARLGFLFESLVPRAATATATATAATNNDTSVRNESSSTASRDLTTSELDSAGSDTSLASLSSGSNTSTNNSTNSPAIGVLVGTRPATKGVIESLRRSNRGLVWIMLEEVEGSSVDLARDALGRAAEAEADIESSVESIAITVGEDEHETTRGSDRMTSPSPPPRAPDPPRGRVRQILWNQAARNLGLEGVDVVKRYISPRRVGTDQDQNQSEERDREEEEVVLSRAGRPLYPVSVF